ncbi:MAG: hypothetical protein IPI07_07925 [Flavobacteriales bacterium]|nr:hypothetical protein [Flavobacteriales bacterium]
MNRNTLGQEAWLSDLVTGSIDPEIRQRLSGLSSALDIGCATGLTLLNLHYAFGTPHCEGVDEISETTATNRALKMLADKGITPGEHSLEALWSIVKTDDSDVIQQITERSLFRKRLHLTYSVDACDYDCQLPEYGLVVVSNVLHYLSFTKAKRLLDKMRSVLGATSIVYVRIRTDFSHREMERMEIIGLCNQMAAEWGLRRYDHSDGVSHTFTNL